MKLRAYLLSFLLLVVGGMVVTRGKEVSSIRTQDWLERNTPASIAGFKMVPGRDGDNVTYRINETRDALQAAGLVGRVFTDGKQQYDVVIVYSDRGESFHDPAACFGAQGWTILRQESKLVALSDGQIEINSLIVKNKEGIEQPAAYCFGTGASIFATQTELLREMFLREVVTMKSQEGAMYRFIGLTSETTPETVLTFASRYLSATHGVAGRG